MQRSFCAWMRDPERAPPPLGLDAEKDRHRLELYRDLVYRNIESFLAASFAQVKARAGRDRWHRLVRDFIRSGRTTTPIFHELPGLFAFWLGEQGLDRDSEQDSLLEQMAHFAWVRHELDFAADPGPAAPPPRDALSEPLHWSPLAWPLRYAWPVHRMQPGPVESAPVHLIAWRDRNDRVHWEETAAGTLLLAERIRAAEGQKTGAELLEQLLDELALPHRQAARRQGAEQLRHFAERHWLTGAAP